MCHESHDSWVTCEPWKKLNTVTVLYRKEKYWWRVVCQSVVLGSTTTGLGITTAVPEASAMEKISIKLNKLHLEYSPQRKIELLLKASKIIYDSMSVSNPGQTPRRAFRPNPFCSQTRTRWNMRVCETCCFLLLLHECSLDGVQVFSLAHTFAPIPL